MIKAQTVTERPAPPSAQLDTPAYRQATEVLGMWVFLLTELMLFGGLFTVYAVYRYIYAEVFVEASRHLDSVIGVINTGLLILSSLTLALAIQSAQTGGRKIVAAFLFLTLALGLAFLGLKGIEYYRHYQEGLVPGARFVYLGEHPQQAQLFFLLYFSMTGTHAVHMVIGLGLVGIMFVRASRHHFSPQHYTPLELTGLYWHFVDILWVFLFPLLYLIGLHGG
jgi:cytochrome c oxidase subunit III